MDRLTAIKIKYEDGTYSDEIPIYVTAENIEYNNEYNLIETLGYIDVKKDGTIQQQINKIINISARIPTLENRIANIQGGTPTVVDSISDMIDTDQIYILSIDSKWYYYDLTSATWAAGGVYGGVPTDTTLTQSGSPADAKVTGDKLNKKITMPSGGTEGQLLQYTGNGGAVWTSFGMPTDAQVESIFSDWLEDHPETTTPVQDESLTYKKLVKGTLGFVTPEMYGAVGDGVTDDTRAFQEALNTGKQVYASNIYYVTSVNVNNNSLLISGEIRGQICINNNAIVEGGIVRQTTDEPCVIMESKLSGGKGYLNGNISKCRLIPTSTGIGIKLQAITNALFGYNVQDIDIASCDKSIYIYNEKWITKGSFSNVFCNTPNYAIFIDNIKGGMTNTADITFDNVFAQYYNHKPINFFRNNSGACLVNLRNSFCYDGIEEYYFYLNPSVSESRIIMLGMLKNDISSVKFTNMNNLKQFFFETTSGGDIVHSKVQNRRNLPLEYYGSAQLQAFSSSPAITRFFGMVGRVGTVFGSSLTNLVFGLSWYDGILTMFRSTDGTVENGYSYKVTTPYSGGVYTTATLPSQVTNGATCWCSDIKMAVTYYSGKWYKPDGTTLSLT